MKKTLSLLIVFITLSCSVDEGEQSQIFYEAIKIEVVNIPDEFQLNEKYKITINYLMPTNWNVFKDLSFEKNEYSRTVAVVAVKYITKENECNVINTECEATFDFLATQTERYLFKFWQGKNNEGEDIYLEIEVPVNN